MYPSPFLNSLRISLHNWVYFLIIPASWETKTIHNFRVKIQFSQIALVHSLTVSPQQIYEFINKALGWAPPDLYKIPSADSVIQVHIWTELFHLK